MEISKKLEVPNFDESLYTEKNIKDCTHGEKVCIYGTLKITHKKTSNGAPYYVLSISDITGYINYIAWNGTPLFLALSESDNGKTVKAYGTIDIGKYRNIDIEQLCFVTETEEEILEKQSMSKSLTISNLRKELNTSVERIISPFLKEIVTEALNLVDEKLDNTPFSEKTAYNYKGGLIHQIIDICDMVNKVTESINFSFNSSSTVLNEDLLLTGAILANLGKTKTLTIENNIPVKTFEGMLDEDSVFSREIAYEAIRIVFDKLPEEEKESYEKIVKELLHMISSVKGNATFGASSTPRSKHALILSQINNLIYTKGLFENLEKSQTGEEFTKAYDNGKNYYLGSTSE